MENGVFEEWWVNPHTYKLSYGRKGFVQTDYASDAGLFRMGEQQWPVGDEALIHQEITQPLPPMPDAKDAELRMATYNGSENLRCVEVAYKPVPADDRRPWDPMYCVDPGKPVLRMTALHAMHNRTTYNRVTQFQGHYIAEEIQRIWDNQTTLTLAVDSIEILPEVDAATFAPPAGATFLAKDKVVLPSGAIFALKTFPLQYPSLAKQIQSDGKVEVHVTIDGLGHVVKVAGATGPALLRQPAIDSVSHWIFRPFLFCGEPVAIDAEVPIAFRLN
jgi:hypothetical protein